MFRDSKTGVRKGRDPDLYLARRPLDGRNGQRAAGERLADRGARRRAVERVAEADERGYLGEPRCGSRLPYSSKSASPA